MALTAREKKFVAAYQGNATEAARAAGYSGAAPTLATQGWRLLRKAEVRDAIGKRDAELIERFTFTVLEIQEQWTLIAADSANPLEIRLSALRELAKSQGAFVHRHEHAIGKSLEDFLREMGEAK